MTNTITPNLAAALDKVIRPNPDINQLRQDLQVAIAMMNDDPIAGIQLSGWTVKLGTYPSFKTSLSNPLTFERGNTAVWLAAATYSRLNWQIADLVNDRYIRHRGFTNDLLETLVDVEENTLLATTHPRTWPWVASNDDGTLFLSKDSSPIVVIPSIEDAKRYMSKSRAAHAAAQAGLKGAGYLNVIEAALQ